MANNSLYTRDPTTGKLVQNQGSNLNGGDTDYSAPYTLQKPTQSGFNIAANLVPKPVSGGILGGIKNSVNQFGANTFGTGEPLPWNPGSSFAGTGTTLTGLMGEAGVGAFVGSLVGNGTIGSQIGGAIGGVAGGELLGATLGSIVPGLGTIIGGAAGSLLGGLFTHKSPPQTSFDTTIGEGNALGPVKYDAYQMPDTTSRVVQSSYQSYLSNISHDLGLDLKDVNINGGVYHGSAFVGTIKGEAKDNAGVEVVRQNFNPTDKESVRQAFANNIIESYKFKHGDISPELEASIKNYKLKDAIPTQENADVNGEFENPAPPMVTNRKDGQQHFGDFVANYRSKQILV